MRVVVSWALTSILLVPVVAEAQPTPKDKWLEVTSPHFTMYSGASKGKTRDITEGLERLRQVIAYLGSDVDELEESPTVFVIFKDERAFLPYMLAPPAKGITRSWESFGDLRRKYILLNGSLTTLELMPWAAEAYAWNLIARRYPTLPYWTKKGLASFYSNVYFDPKGKVRIGRPIEEDIRHLRRYSLVPLEQFFRIDQGSQAFANGEFVRLHHAQSWLLTHFMMTGGGGDPARGRQFMNLVTSGLHPEEAVRRAFGTELDGLESQLRAYVNAPSLPAFTLRADIVSVPDVQPVPMELAEISYQLGYYLTTAIDPAPLDLTERHLEPLVQSGYRRGDALAALGELRRKSGRPDAAARLFSEAFEAAPETAESYYFMASFHGESTAGDRELVRVCLEKAVGIEPSFGRAWVELAQAYEAEGEVEKAVAALEKGVEQIADQPVLAHNLVMLHLRNGDTAGARQAMDRHVNAAHRAEVEEVIARQEEVERHNRQVDLYNRAGERLRDGDVEGARSLLEELLEEETSPELAAPVRDLLEAIDRARPSAGKTDDAP